MKRTIALLGALAILGSAVSLPVYAAEPEEVPESEWTEPTDTTYRAFLQEHETTARPEKTVEVNITAYTGEGDNRLTDKVLDRSGQSLYTGENGYVEFQVQVPEEGLYAIRMEFVSEYQRGISVERKILINGETQHAEAESVVFGRIYQDAEGERGQTDAAGNDIRPSQVEVRKWQEKYLTDSQGYFQSPLLFYFREGTNTLRLESLAEPMTIGSITLENPETLPTYEEKAAEYAREGYQKAEQPVIPIQGEDAVLKSNPMLYPSIDRTSPVTDPPALERQVMNTIGGSRWSEPGQTLTWEFTVEEAGLYCLNIKFRQNILRGVTSNRKILIDGEVPFEEFQDVEFSYHNKWQSETLGSNGSPYWFYLKEGSHTLSMEVCMGPMSEPVNRVQEILTELNGIYTKIMIITGSKPDPMRDYMLNELIPEDVLRLGELGEQLGEVSQWFTDYTGGKSQTVSTLDTMVRLLDKMGRDADYIPKNLEYLKSNIGSLGNWLTDVRSQPLEIDYFVLVSSDDPELAPPNAGFFQQLAFDIQLFLNSFFEDYSSVGASGEESQQETIRVWIPTGRDQAQVLRKLIDSDFSPKNGIGVKLELVDGGALLPATVAGIGPDVALNMADTEPINYAIRNAIIDLRQFSDYAEVAERFLPERMVPLSFNGSVYALPETQSFNVLFYRKDVLNNLGIEIPQTWEDVVSVIPLLQKNNMSFAMPAATSTFYSMLFQNGGNLYEDNGRVSALDSLVGLTTFKQWTNMYVNYELPQSYDFLSRFRTGEYPLIVADFSSFNTLVVSAPEIRGLWSFTLMPGTQKEDGSIDRSVTTGGTNCFILKNSAHHDAAWKFLKWWTSEDTQLRFGSEMESVLGESARYSSANMAAFERVSWASDLYKVLEEQMTWSKGIEQVPGGYFTERHVMNAFRKVVIGSGDPKDTLYDYVYTINQELTGKRKEFGLSDD